MLPRPHSQVQAPFFKHPPSGIAHQQGTWAQDLAVRLLQPEPSRRLGMKAPNQTMHWPLHRIQASLTTAGTLCKTLLINQALGHRIWWLGCWRGSPRGGWAWGRGGPTTCAGTSGSTPWTGMRCTLASWTPPASPGTTRPSDSKTWWWALVSRGSVLAGPAPVSLHGHPFCVWLGRRPVGLRVSVASMPPTQLPGTRQQ